MMVHDGVDVLQIDFFVDKKKTIVEKDDILSEEMTFHLLPVVKTFLEKPI